MQTPEGKVKQKVKEFLHSRKVQSLTHPIEGAVGFYWMPVVSGMGAPFLDFMIIYKGTLVAIETKASGEPTVRQRIIMGMVNDAGGRCWWGDDVKVINYLHVLFAHLDGK